MAGLQIGDVESRKMGHVILPRLWRGTPCLSGQSADDSSSRRARYRDTKGYQQRLRELVM